MKTVTSLLFYLFLFQSPFVFSQEWKTLHAYQKETGNTVLQDGCWLRKDRKKQTDQFGKANLYNLTVEKGHLKYKRIREIEAFYGWFDQERVKQGHEMEWAGVAALVAGQLSNMECGFIRTLIVRNDEVAVFAQEGSQKVFAFAFPKLRTVYFSAQPIQGAAAQAWDREYGKEEQCLILQPLYDRLSAKALHKLERIAKGKGIFALAVSKKMRYEGEIVNCELRYLHGMKLQDVLHAKNKKQ